MGSVPTVKVVTEGGFMVINEADFDPEVHRRYGEEGEASPPTETPGTQFASPAAEDAADDLELEDEDFAGQKPSGKGGFTKADVERIAGAKG